MKIFLEDEGFKSKQDYNKKRKRFWIMKNYVFKEILTTKKLT